MRLPSIHDEKELLLRLKQGDEQAFTLLYNNYWKPVFVIASKKTNQLTDAEEIVQEIFLDIWNRRSSLEINGTLSSYLSACVKYKVLTVFARNHQAAQYQEYLHKKTMVDHTTERWLSFEELKNEFLKESDKLPEKCKLVFELSRQKGLTQKQIAHQLNISEKTVESHLSKALRTLRIGLSQFLTHLF